MLDINHLITRPGVDVQVFTLPSTVTNLQWHTWNRPRGTAFSQMLAIGGGGGGGGGFTRVAGAAGGGGGGGGGSGHAQLAIPLELLPDMLYIQVALGGVGGLGGGGGTGMISYISFFPNLSAAFNNILASTIASGSGGAAGTGTGAGAGGGSGTATTIATGNPLAGLGIWNSTVGQVGTAGGVQTGSGGTNIAFPTIGLLTMGGTGGGGTTFGDFVGGGITAIANSLLSDIRPTNAAAGSNDGSGGFNVMKPFFSFPGMGGGASNAGVGGRGGNGFYGSGGGGGGAGTTGGRGGDGGNGLVIIVSY